MSNYRVPAFHPKTGRLEVVTIHDLPKEHSFYAAFEDGETVGPLRLREPDPVDLFEIAEAMVETLDLIGIGDLSLSDRERTRAALSRWREFTNAKSDEDALTDFANKLAAEQEPLPADMQRILDEMQDKLYEDGTLRTNAKETKDG